MDRLTYLHLSRKVRAMLVRLDSKIKLKRSHWFERIMACIRLRSLTSFGALFVAASACRACHTDFMPTHSPLHSHIVSQTRRLVNDSLTLVKHCHTTHINVKFVADSTSKSLNVRHHYRYRRRIQIASQVNLSLIHI